MAISRAQLLKELLPALNELFGMEYEMGWAVFHKRKRVTKVEPWDSSKHTCVKKKKRVVRTGIMHIINVPDELGAYMEATRRLEGADK
jgi:hypothetical protein